MSEEHAKQFITINGTPYVNLELIEKVIKNANDILNNGNTVGSVEYLLEELISEFANYEAEKIQVQH